jgi:Bifunctional DNA primase/polymerase, N-terminal/AAA domain/Primase C terminal 2 (PriCT-2)
MGRQRKGPSARTEGPHVSDKPTKTKHENNTRSQSKGNPFLHWALKYARSGFPVFPCEVRGKAPEGRLAPEGYKNATTNPGKIKKWWKGRSQWNIGLVPPKGMAILDIDPRNGGEKTWKKLNGLGEGLRDEGLVALTGGGGQHIILSKIPERLPGKLGKGIDIKRNGYVIAEPSIHPDTGKKYKWVSGWNPEEVQQWPKGLTPIRVDGSNGEKREKGERGDLTLTQLRRALRKINPNDYEDWIAIGQALKQDYPDEGFELWTWWSSKSEKWPGEKAARVKWRSFKGEGRGTGTIIHMSGGKVPKTSAREDFGVDEAEESPEVRREIEKGRKQKQEKADKAEGEKGKLVLINLSEVEEKKIDWLIPGYLAKGMLHCLAGFGGEGKSNVASAIIASLTRGKNLVDGEKLPDGKTKVLMVTEEPLAYQTLPRLRLAGADTSRVHIIDSVRRDVKGQEKVVAWNLQDHLEQVRELLEEDRSYRILVIDPIGSYMTGKKKSIDTWKDSDVRDVLRPWQDLAEKQNIAVLFIAHFNKGKTARAAEKVTGSSAFTTVTRITYLVGRPPAEWMEQFGLEKPRDGGGDRVLLSIKRNVGREPDLLVFSCDPVVGEDAPEVKYKGTLPVQYAAEVEALVLHEANGGSYDSGHKGTALEAIEETPGITGTQLAEILGVSMPNLIHAMDPLIKANKVVRIKKGQTVHWYLPGQEFEDNQDLF